MKRHLLILSFPLIFFSTSFALAQPTCETLVDDLETAFGEAESLMSEVEVVANGREMGYQKARLYRDDAGELQSEVIEERGQRPPEDEGEDEGDEEFSFSCEGNELELLGSDGSYRLTLQEDDEEIPVDEYRLEFTPREGRYVPRSIIANFNTTFVLIPVRGTFTTKLSEWTFPE